MTALLRRLTVLALIVLVILGTWFVLGMLPAGRDAARSPQTPKPAAWMPTATATKPPPTPRPTATPWPTAIPPTATPSPSPTPAPPTPTTAPSPSPTPVPTLSPELVTVARANGFDPAGDFIVINQNTQLMHVVKRGIEIRTVPVSTGDPDQGYETPAWSGKVGRYWGTFLGLGGVWADNGWWLFKAPGGNILIHGLPYLLKDGVKEYEDAEALGLYPASHGCIRLHVQDAEWFTRLQPEGMPIVILPYTGGSSREG
ncbi:MAG: L,D-transpeptidase [Anaerolineae bacterium]|nr:L,D-transpeptidase [Anaerolineae bacterium]